MLPLSFDSTDVTEEEGLFKDTEVVMFFFHLEKNI